MAEAVISVTLKTIHDLLSDEFKLLGGVSSQVRSLESQLNELKSLVKDAERKRHESSSVRGWIADIRDLAYRSEDAIESYAAVQRLRRHGLRRCSCILKEATSLHRIGTEISLIKSEIARVTKSMQGYGIRSIITVTDDESESSTADVVNQQWRRRTFPYEIEEAFVGKDKELEHLLSLVVDHEEPRVISIWGMGGIGKTTLARKVYNHHRTRRFFESFAWVCVSQQCRIRSVLEDVLSALKRDGNCSDLSDTELMEQLCEIQKAKRCMIVVDDIWKIGHWEGLRHAFLVRGALSKILLTTRKQNVAEIGYAFKAGLLSESEGWELLKRKAFPYTNLPNFQFEEKILEKIGKEMVCKCGKLPLAISLLGGILSKKKSMKEWELINKNISSYLYRGGEGLENEKDEIHGVLNFSYHELPYYLKSCFLFMGRYKEDELIQATDLCLMWIAQGMVSYGNEPKEMKLIDIAQNYISELASRCVVEIATDDPIRGQTSRFCKLHDVVRELCLSMGKEENFGLQILNYETGKFSSLLHERLLHAKTRHLVINFKNEMELESKEICCDEDSAKLVRSLHFENCTGKRITEFPHNIIDLKKFKLLKILVFKGFNFVGNKLPRGIDKPIHLRYLHLEACKFDKLPSSISNLVYLHTLDLTASKNVRIPNNVLDKMLRLKHLYLSAYNVGERRSHRLRLKGLDELETLMEFNSLVHDLKSVIGLKNLLYFEGTIHDNKSLSEIIHAISTSWKNLRYCGLGIKKDCCVTSMEEDFMKLFICPNLHTLWIYVPIGKLLQEVENHIHASSLVFLYMEGCEIEDDPMETLGKLPLLRYLILRKCFTGEEMTCHVNGFPRLETLDIECLPNLREWRVEQESMPLVSDIHIYRCPHLEMVPDGFRFLAALTDLYIVGVPELNKRVCDEEGEDFEKVRHVPSVVIR